MLALLRNPNQLLYLSYRNYKNSHFQDVLKQRRTIRKMMLIRHFVCALAVCVFLVKASEPIATTTDNTPGDENITLLPQQNPTVTDTTEPTVQPPEQVAGIEAEQVATGIEEDQVDFIDEQLRPPFIPGGGCVFCPGFIPRCPCRFPFECQLIPRTCFTCPRWTCARSQCVFCPPGLPPCRCGPFSRCVYEPGTCFRCAGWRCVPSGPFPPFPPFPPF